MHVHRSELMNPESDTITEGAEPSLRKGNRKADVAGRIADLLKSLSQ